MFNLPIGFPLHDFEQCSLFAHQMILDQSVVESGGSINLDNVLLDGVHTEFPLLVEYLLMCKSDGMDVAYYYHLISYYQLFDECQEAYKAVIVNCSGDASDITEIPYVISHEGEEYESAFIGATAHEAVFFYLKALCEAIEDYCFSGDSDEPSVDEIKSNLFEIKRQSSRYSIDSYDAQRVACKMHRELLIVTGRYGSQTEKKTVTTSGLCSVIGKVVRSKPYKKPWFSGWKKTIPDFPSPIKSGGSSEETYLFSQVKPILDREFGVHDWENI